MDFNKIVDIRRPGVLVYGSTGGYSVLSDYNLDNVKYSEDLYDVSTAFTLNVDSKMFSRTLKKGMTIYTIYTGNIDFANRSGYYSISLFYDRGYPSMEDAIGLLINLQQKFNSSIIDQTNKKILIARIKDFKQIISDIPILPLSEHWDSFNSEVKVLEVNSLDLGNIECQDAFAFIDRVDKSETIFLCKNGTRKGTQLIKNGVDTKDLIHLDSNAIRHILELEKMKHKFVFSSTSKNESLIEGQLSITSAGITETWRIENTSNEIELIIRNEEDYLDVRFDPDDNEKFEVYHENKPIKHYLNTGGNNFTIVVSEKPFIQFALTSDIQILSLKVLSNGQHVPIVNTSFTIYDLDARIQILSSSHEAYEVNLANENQKIEYVNRGNNWNLNLLSNYITIQVRDKSNNLLNVGEDVTLFVNNKKVTSNIIKRSELPISVFAESKRYGKSEVHQLNRQSKSKLEINFPYGAPIGKPDTNKKSGGISTIEPYPIIPWYKRMKKRILILLSLIFVIILGSGIYWWKSRTTCENLANRPKEEQKTFCKGETCVPCKKWRILDTLTCVGLNNQDSIIIKEFCGKPENKGCLVCQSSEPIIKDSKLTQTDTQVKSDSTLVTSGDSSKEVKVEDTNKGETTCNNVKSKTDSERETFCKKPKNYSCVNCAVTCANWKEQPGNRQIGYCEQDNACEKCPKKYCDELANASGTTLVNLCKSDPKYKKCQKCQKCLDLIKQQE
jgi:hypothetical protein